MPFLQSKIGQLQLKLDITGWVPQSLDILWERFLVSLGKDSVGLSQVSEQKGPEEVPLSGLVEMSCITVMGLEAESGDTYLGTSWVKYRKSLCCFSQ